MNDGVKFVSKHKWIFLAVGALIVAYILYKLFANRGTATSTTPVTTTDSSVPVSSIPGSSAPSNYAPVTNTTTTTDTSSNYSDVYSPYSSSSVSSSSVYSPYSSTSSQSSVSTNTSTSTVDSHNQANTYNNQQYGLSQPPSGFTGVAGVSAQPLPQQNNILPYQPWTPAYQQAAVNAIAAARAPVQAVSSPAINPLPLVSGGIGVVAGSSAGAGGHLLP